MLSRFSKLAAAALFLSGAAALAGAHAQSSPNYPAQPIRFIITHPAGGLPDTVARIFGRRLEQRLGQSVIVENRSGANGAVAVNGMFSAPRNGYTFVVTDGAIWSVNPLINPQLSYSVKDLRAVALLANAPLFLAVHPKVPANTLDEFIAYVRINPGKVNYGSSGLGSNHHLSMVAMAYALKLDTTHVPFKGTGKSVPALLGGHVEALFSAYPSLIGANETKQVRMLAANGAKRSSLAPDLPSIAERIPGYDYSVIIGIYAPRETHDDIVNRIAMESAEIAKEPDVIQRLTILGVEAVGVGPEAFAKALNDETRRVEALIKETGLKLK